jgi:hypothetical protein
MTRTVGRGWMQRHASDTAFTSRVYCTSRCGDGTGSCIGVSPTLAVVARPAFDGGIDDESATLIHVLGGA